VANLSRNAQGEYVWPIDDGCGADAGHD
jgi:hypothetical protein